MDKIIEENLLIARFMNVPPEANVHGLKYHESWDKLMPVVEGIENMGQTIVEIGKKHCRITPVLYDLKTDSMEWHPMIEMIGQTKLETTYKAVVKYIKWYNQQKQ